MRCTIQALAAMAIVAMTRVTPAASIIGFVYEDRDSSGAHTSGEGLPGVIVSLYEDDGNGRFDEFDRQLGNSLITNPDGSYTFSHLEATKGYFIRQPQQTFEGVLLAPRTSELSLPGNGQLIIDEFSATQVANVSPNIKVKNSSTRSESILGGERDISAEFLHGPTRAKVRVNPYGLAAVFQLDQAAGVSAKATITWDGIGGALSSTPGSGLGGIDLTNHGVNEGIELRIGVDGAGADDTLSLRLFDDTHPTYSEARFAPPTTSGAATVSLLIPFSAFEGPVAPTAVDAIQLVIGEMGASIDLQLDQISIMGPNVQDIAVVAVPEPTSLGLAGAVGCLLAFLATRRSRQRVPNNQGMAMSKPLLVACFACLSVVTVADRVFGKPNIIFILADDLGYGDLGCYGQQLIKTPHLDRMAAEGMKFRNFYAGCTVCAPSRSVLMTGQHMGHTYVRGNGSGREQALRAEDFTVAEMLKAAGYATALCGKWGLGDDRPGDTGLPNDQGFDHFFGYLNQVHAHNYYPEFLWRDKDRVSLRNEVVTFANRYGGFAGGYATERVDYSHDLVMGDALQFVRDHRDGPFFLYLALTIPHANNEGTRGTGNGQETPHFGIYAQQAWPDQDKGQAAMISRMDHGIGVLLRTLKQLRIDEQTVVMFTSDNGPHDEGGHDTERFDPNGPLRGMKRDLYEGGIRVPLIVRWPGTTPPGSVTDHISYFGDLMATAAELADAEAPENIDSISFAPTLRGQYDQQQSHDFLYWEFYERGSKQAVRFGNWKAIRMPMLTGTTQLYDLNEDLGEAHDVAAQHAPIIAEAERMMAAAHRPNPNWAPSGSLSKLQPAPGDGRPRF